MSTPENPICISLPSTYNIVVIAIDIRSQTPKKNTLYTLNTTSFATETIKQHIATILQPQDTQLARIDFNGYKEEEEDLNQIKLHFQNELKRISENTR
jgi:hypothetical protein